MWAYVRRWWEETHPTWQVVEGACPDGPWVKALAVADALSRADGDVLVLADADVLCSGVAAAVARVTSGSAPWAIPHGRVYRLSPPGTAVVLGGGPLPALPGPTRTAPRRPGQRPRDLIRLREGPIHEHHTGAVGGGLVVLPRDLYQQVPLDPRFVSWGQEDCAWGEALGVIAGPANGEPDDRRRRLLPPLWHLWHPPQERTWRTGQSQSRAIGSPEGFALRQRYRDAARSGPVAVRALLAEAACSAAAISDGSHDGMDGLTRE